MCLWRSSSSNVLNNKIPFSIQRWPPPFPIQSLWRPKLFSSRQQLIDWHRSVIIRRLTNPPPTNQLCCNWLSCLDKASAGWARPKWFQWKYPKGNERLWLWLCSIESLAVFRDRETGSVRRISNYGAKRRIKQKKGDTFSVWRLFGP